MYCCQCLPYISAKQFKVRKDIPNQITQISVIPYEGDDFIEEGIQEVPEMPNVLNLQLPDQTTHLTMAFTVHDLIDPRRGNRVSTQFIPYVDTMKISTVINEYRIV